MAKFRKKPVVIEARQFTGPDTALDICRWASEYDCAAADWLVIAGFAHEDAVLIIPTLEGDHCASVGDWIIKGVAGEFYPCKPDIFAATYEMVDP